jgi:cupin 2 domain-containing protein
MSDITLAITKENWRKRGYTCGIWIDPPGQTWNDFLHDSDELLMLVEGEMELVIGDKVFYPKIYEEFLIPANTRHSVKNIGDATNRWFYGYKLCR